MGFMVQVRTVGRGMWAGTSTGGQWKPACGGTLNQTGKSDEYASTFDTEGEALQIMREITEGGNPDADSDFRVVEVASMAPGRTDMTEADFGSRLARPASPGKGPVGPTGIPGGGLSPGEWREWMRGR